MTVPINQQSQSPSQLQSPSKLQSLSQSLFTSSGLHRYFANTSWLFGEKILRMMVGFFVGVWVARNLGPEKYGTVRRMMDAQIHRGPDDSGLYQDQNIVLGHRRLAIIDLSPAGRQPMSNEDGTIWIIYNGEIYNYRELREMLIKKGHKFKSNSDTEVIIHGYEEWGVDGLLQRLRGMFALAIYDPRSTIHNSRFTINYSRLILARDRIGIKPLYYSYCDDFLLFASGLNAILASKLVSKEIDPKAVVLFLLYGSIPPPQTIYKEIFALEPGHFLIIDEKGLKKNRYYDLKNGFLDTSLMGISFPDTPYDESRYSKIAARKFNTDHAEIEITDKDLINHMDKIFYIMDQPSIDGVNTYFVSWATNKSGLKVAMSGVGGDEIFWGYPSFTHIPRLFHHFKILSWVPLGKRTAQFILRNSNSFKTAKLYSMVSNSSSIPDIYLNYRGLFTKEQIYKLLHQDFVRHAMEGVEQMSYLQECSEINDEHNQVSLLETTFYMANQLLRDTDVFSMAHSLEVRVPFVDHTLVELLAKIPARYKTIYPKRLLIKALNNKLPDEIVHRPKMGFTFPFDLWMRNELKGFIEENLNSSTLFNRSCIKRLLEDFYNHKVHWSRIWACAVLTWWLK